MSDLRNAIFGGDLAAVRREMRDGDAVIDDGRRPLSLAAGLGNLELVELLIELGAPLDGQDRTNLGYTALITAVREDQHATVRRLLALGADVNAGDSIHGRPLHHAGVGGQAELAQLLLDTGAAVDAPDDREVTPLIRVALHANRAQWTALIPGGRRGKPIEHPLHDAHLATADVLLGAGADPDHIGTEGYAALHYAAENGAAPLVKRLLAAGARPNLQNGKGYTPLHAACEAKQVKVVRALLAAGADPNLRDSYGFSALHSTAIKGSVTVARVLLKAGADRTHEVIEGYDKVVAGMTPSEAATAYEHYHVAALIG